jgi:hypothetical protein
MIIPSVQKRRDDDKKRARLMALDALDGGDRCRKWTVGEYPNIRWTLEQLGYALDRLTAVMEVTSE